MKSYDQVTKWDKWDSKMDEQQQEHGDFFYTAKLYN